MPVSDTTTVLSKLFTALVVSGAIVIVVTLVTQLAVLLLATVILMFSGASPGSIWSNLQLVRADGHDHLRADRDGAVVRAGDRRGCCWSPPGRSA